MIYDKILSGYINDIDSAIKESFDLAIRNQRNQNDFIAFLEDGHLKYNRAILGHSIDIQKDQSRQEYFLAYTKIDYLEIIQKEPNTELKELINRLSIHQELMIYSHFWESKTNLNRLYQLTNLINSKPYDWKNDFPTKSKQKLIRIHVRRELDKKKLMLPRVIQSCYRSQIRNAFAHSQYYFDGEEIGLDNYKNLDWEVKSVHQNDWHDYFGKTALLFDLLLKNISFYKQELSKKSEEYEIIQPNGIHRKAIFKEEFMKFEWKE